MTPCRFVALSVRLPWRRASQRVWPASIRLATATGVYRTQQKPRIERKSSGVDLHWVVYWIVSAIYAAGVCSVRTLHFLSQIMTDRSNRYIVDLLPNAKEWAKKLENKWQRPLADTRAPYMMPKQQLNLPQGALNHLYHEETFSHGVALSNLVPGITCWQYLTTD